MNGYEDAGEFDITDLLGDINRAQHELATGLRGSSSYAKSLVGAAEDHHMFPRALSLRQLFRGIDINKIPVQLDAYIHQFGVHQKGTGGAYIKVWERFKKETRNRNPFYLVGFGFGLMGRLPIY